MDQLTQTVSSLGCVELNADGSYYAEVFTAAYDGLEPYLQLPFERILGGVKDRKPARYVMGYYTANANSYELEGLGTLSFEEDMLFAHYSFEGQSYRDRCGFSTGDKMPAFTSAAGRWTPYRTVVQVTNLADETPFSASYGSADFGLIAADIAEKYAPELSTHLSVFEGYKIVQLTVSQLNTFVFDYSGGKQLGGYWNFSPVQGTVGKTLPDKRLLTTDLNFTPSLTGNEMTLSVTGTIFLDNTPSYTLSASIQLH